MCLSFFCLNAKIHTIEVFTVTKKVIEETYDILKEDRELSEKRRNLLLVLIFSLTLIISIVSATMVYFKIRQLNTDKNPIIIDSTASLTITYEAGQKLTIKDVKPGYESEPMVIKIKNNSKKSITYNLLWTDVANSFNDQLLLTIKKSDQIIYNEIITPKSETAMLDEITIGEYEEHKYELIFKYIGDNEVPSLFTSLIKLEIKK